MRERDYFFIGSFAFFGVLVAWRPRRAHAGASPTGSATAAAASRAGPRRAPVLLLALIPLFGNHVTASRANETLARDFAIDMLESVEPYGILITAGDNDTFPLWYAQEVSASAPT